MFAPLNITSREKELHYVLYKDVPITSLPMHWHSEYELTYASKGSFRCLIDSVEYKVEEGNAPSNLTLEQFYNEYLRDLSSEIRASSMAKKKSRLENHVIPALGQIRLSKLTVPVLQNWKNEISEKDMMLSTKRGIYTEFNAMLITPLKRIICKATPLKNSARLRIPIILISPRKRYSIIPQMNSEGLYLPLMLMGIA